MSYLHCIKKYLLKLYSFSIYYVCKQGNSKKITSYKNKHIGQRIFIICNGPSLRSTDLDKIMQNGDISFACNKIDKIFNQTIWRPTYYTIMDGGYQYSLLDTINNVPAKAKFFRIESYCTTHKAKGNCIFLHTDGDRSLLNSPKFSEECNRIVYIIATVTYAMLQLAVYMGCREIYIIGCDNSYAREIRKDGTIVNTGRASYFTGSDPKDTAKIIAPTWELDIAYEYARKYADEHGIKIYNATRGGCLEAFERVDFDSLF